MFKINGIHEIITKKEDFYKIKTELEKNIQFFYSGIEWRASNYQNLNKEQSKKMIEVLSSLEEIDDVQNVFTNANLKIEYYENNRHRPRTKWSNSSSRK